MAETSPARRLFGTRTSEEFTLKRSAVILLLLLLAIVPAFAQRFEARSFGQDDGLDNLAISTIAQDNQGFLWVASQNGLFRYDGARFQLFGASEGITDPSVFTLLVDHSGTLWAGSHNGLFWFDGRAFHELRYEGASLRVGTNSMLASTAAGEVAVATSKELFSVEQGSDDKETNRWSIVPYRLRHPSFPKIDDMNGIGVDSADQFWVGCGEAICGFKEPALQTLGKEQGVPPDFYMSFFLARDGRMYARGRKNIVTWKQGDKDVIDLTALFPSGGTKTIHRRFTEDAFGRILTPTSSGFAIWDGVHWAETVSTSRGTIDGASEVFSDREGALWIGTQGSGLLQSLGYGLWKNYGTVEGLSDPHVFAIALDKSGTLWAGHDKGVSRLQPGTSSFAASSLASDPDASQIQSLASSSDGGMWIGALLGHIFHVDASGKVDISVAIDTYVRRLRLDSAGVLWAATSTGVYTLNCKAGVLCNPQPVASLDKASIRDLAIDHHGTVWATADSGLYRIESVQSSATHITVPVELKDFDLIAAAADSTLWITRGKLGICHLQIDSGPALNQAAAVAHLLESIPATQLASSQIVSLDLDRTGRLWIGTDHGLNVLRDGKLERITEDDGLIWNDIDSRAFLADPDGSIWIGTSHGVSHLLNPAVIFDRPAFSAQVAIGQYNDTILPSGASILWNGGVTAFHFSGLTFRDNRELVYHYSLIGFDSASVLTHSPFVRFQKLPPGTYTFRVVAEDTVHGILSAPAEYTFTLTPPWWRTKSFYVLVILVGLCVLALIWTWSERALLAQRNKLQRLVAERTYELEQLAVRDSLTGLLNRNAIMTALTSEVQNAKKYNSPLCIALIDLDHFKSINDTFGHLAGDEVLRRSAERLQSAIRNSDAIGRYGGEEFLIIFRNVEQHFGVERSELVRTALSAEPIVFGPHRLNVTCSIGVAWSGATADPLNGLVAKADRAMYLAKENGRNRTEYALPD